MYMMHILSKMHIDNYYHIHLSSTYIPILRNKEFLSSREIAYLMQCVFRFHVGKVQFLHSVELISPDETDLRAVLQVSNQIIAG